MESLGVTVVSASGRDEAERAWGRVLEQVRRFPDEVRALPVHRQADPETVRGMIAERYTFAAPVPLDALTDEVIALLRDWSTHVTHPRYFGLFNPSVREAGVIADTLVALFNPQLAVWSHSPAASEIERLVLGTFSRALGFNAGTVLANFCSGGMEANLSAVLAALALHYPGCGESGVAGYPAPPALYLTGESHHSFDKIARMTGIGTRALRLVATQPNGTMDTDALEACIDADRRSGVRPLLVVGTAGTTGAGLIDPLPRIAEIAERHGLWFHADAAWGGSAVLSPRLRPLLAGIERADSVTWDAHKWLSVPLAAGMVFCRHPEAMKEAFAISTTYMPGSAGDLTVDPYRTTAQWSRRMIGLKVFLSLAELGLDGYAALIDTQAAMGDLLRSELAAAGWIVCNDTRLPVVCFTHADIRTGRLRTTGMLDALYARGRVWISDVAFGGEQVLRACITSYRTDASDIDCLLGELEEVRHRALSS
jgi:aromatic-L-amino-acid/L-tryptophan decarboxylase